MPEAKDGFFTTYYAFNKIALDVLMGKFNIQVDNDTVTQLVSLHSDIPGYDLPAINFVSPQEEAHENHILKFIYLKYADIWQSASVICSYAAFLCDILLIVTFTIFFLKYSKTMQAMLVAFISTNTSGIPPTKVNPIGRMFPPLFTINLPEED